MKKILTGWHLMRVIRLLMGIVAIGQAIVTKEWILGLAGGFLLYMALANLGCYCVNSCSVQPPDVNRKPPDTKI